MLEQLFGTLNHVSPGQECARAVLIFVYGLIAVRLVGHRAFGRWSALDIVVAILVGSSLSRVLTGNAPLLGTLAGVSLLFALHWAIARAAARSSGVARVVEGEGQPVLADGIPDRSALHRHGISEIDLTEALRQSGLTEPAQARSITLEPSGKLSVHPRKG